MKLILSLVAASAFLVSAISANPVPHKCPFDCSTIALAGWAWECVEDGCGVGGSASTRDEANSAGKEHEVANKGHRWTIYETN